MPKCKTDWLTLLLMIGMVALGLALYWWWFW